MSSSLIVSIIRFAKPPEICIKKYDSVFKNYSDLSPFKWWIVQLSNLKKFFSHWSEQFSKQNAIAMHCYDHYFLFFSCTFHSVGTAAGEQKFNSLCVLSLNIINEKIYILLWFWLFFISGITAVHLVYRLLTIMMPYSR